MLERAIDLQTALKTSFHASMLRRWSRRGIFVSVLQVLKVQKYLAICVSYFLYMQMVNCKYQLATLLKNNLLGLLNKYEVHKSNLQTRNLPISTSQMWNVQHRTIERNSKRSHISNESDWVGLWRSKEKQSSILAKIKRLLQWCPLGTADWEKEFDAIDFGVRNKFPS